MPQNLRVDGYGLWEILRTFVLGEGRHLHQTSTGFYFSPSQPLTDPAVAGTLPGKFKDEALAFIEGQKPKAEEPEYPAEPSMMETEMPEQEEEDSGRRRRR